MDVRPRVSTILTMKTKPTTPAKSPKAKRTAKAGRPEKAPAADGSRTINVAARIPMEWMKRLELNAKKHDRSLSKEIYRAVRTYMITEGLVPPPDEAAAEK